MKVKIEITLNVDIEKYRNEYGEGLSADDIRKQVEWDAYGAAMEHFDRFDFLVKG